MDEYILPAIVGCDEAKTLVLVEKLNGAGCHGYPRETSGFAPPANIMDRLTFPQPFILDSATVCGKPRLVRGRSLHFSSRHVSLRMTK